MPAIPGWAIFDNSIWNFDFSYFREISFSNSNISFVYAYTKEMLELLKEISRKYEKSKFQIELSKMAQPGIAGTKNS